MSEEIESRVSLQAEIYLKAWETYQNIAKSNGESSWVIRAWGISVWCALVAYSFGNGIKAMLWVALVELSAAFLMELAARQIQYAFIQKSLEVERAIESMVVGEEIKLPPGGISTNIPTPTLSSLFELLSLRRWQIWFPYALLLVFTLLALKLS
jgi:hypothetical protein